VLPIFLYLFIKIKSTFLTLLGVWFSPYSFEFFILLLLFHILTL
jgi:hypothetical protein